MSKKKTSASTPATAELVRLGVRFEMREYKHDPAVSDYGQEAAEALSVEPAQVFKTLMAEADGKLIVGIVPVSGLLDLKALAAAVEARKAEMADLRLAERKTGYVVGGISPIGQRSRLCTVLDESAMNFETILVSGGRRGLDIELAPLDLIRVTDAQLASIARAK